MIAFHAPVEPWARRGAEGLHVTLLLSGAAAPEVAVRALIDNEETDLPLVRRPHAGSRWQRWTGTVPWCGSRPALRYCFRIVDHGAAHWLGAAGSSRRPIPVQAQFRVAREPVVPDWAPHQVIYQIFPDRFARAGTGPVKAPPVLHAARAEPSVVLPWGERDPPGAHGRVFFGGDLAGIEARLDHLQSLGVTTVYLTPVFHATSNHRYDTQDYTQVDPMLGGNQALASLAHALHARGMKLVLDAVLNHTGANHPWINRWGQHPEPGAAQSRDSRWADWYARDASGTIAGWKGHDSLPVLDYANPEVLEAMVSGADSVLRRWLRPPVAADGWRLDVVHMLGEGMGARGNRRVLREIRSAVKSERADALIIGEHFAQADEWLQGDAEDGAMNYWGFTRPVWAWIAGRDFHGRPAAIGGAEALGWMVEAAAAVPYEVQLTNWNLIDSHDVPRLVTALGGDVARWAAAVVLQFTWPGVPSVYYGDEVGLEGGADPDNRRCFRWDEAQWSRDSLALVRRLGALRHERDEWRTGALAVLGAGEEWVAFARLTAAAVTVVVIARSALTDTIVIPLESLPFDVRAWIALDGPWPDATRWQVDAGSITLSLASAGALVLTGVPR